MVDDKQTINDNERKLAKEFAHLIVSEMKMHEERTRFVFGDNLRNGDTIEVPVYTPHPNNTEGDKT